MKETKLEPVTLSQIKAQAQAMYLRLRREGLSHPMALAAVAEYVFQKARQEA